MGANVSETKKLRAAVVGGGHMGRHHVRVYSQLPNVELVAVVDADLARATELTQKHGGMPIQNVDEIIDRIDIASIAVPTIAHLAVAKKFITAGKAILIEKPLAGSVDEGQQIVDLAEKHGVTVQVGHTERFNPVVVSLRKMDVRPRFIETHRISPFTFRSADIGVVMDMMIHDIDIILSLVRTKVVNVEAVGINVLGANEDIANARLTFEDGCVANLTASRLALKTERKIRVFSEQAYLSLDYQKKSGLAVRKESNLDILKLAQERKIEDLAQLAGGDYSKLVKVEPLMINDEEPLRAELSAFVDSVIGHTTPVVTARDGLLAVETADRIVKAIGDHNWKVG